MQAVLDCDPSKIYEEDQLAKTQSAKTDARTDDIDKRLNAVEHSLSGFRVGLKVAGVFMGIAILPLCAWVVYTTHALSVSMAALDSKVSALQRQTTQIMFKQGATDPTTPEGIENIKFALDSAKKQNFKLPVDEVANAGEKLVAVYSSNQAAWDTALQLANYRSSLNASIADFENHLAGIQTLSNTHYGIEFPPNVEPPKITAYGVAPIDKAARLQLIGQDTNTGPAGNQFLILDGGTIALDDVHIKNVIMRGVHVVHRGRPVIVDHVYFLDCTFDISPTPKGQMLAEDVIKNVPTNVSAT